MSRSFEDKLKDHLGDYQVPPPPHAKERLFGAKPVSNPSVFYSYLGVGLFLISIFMLGRNSVEVDSVGEGSESIASEKIAGSRLAEIFESSICMESANMQCELSDLDIELPFQKSSSNQMSRMNDDLFDIQEGNRELTFGESKNMHEIEGLGFLKHDNYNKFPDLIQKRQRNRKEVIPVKSRSSFKTYYDLGAYFIYNRLKPNLNDELYITNYDAPFSISPSRIGGVFHFGFERNWSENHTSRLGLVLNNYNQHFAFQIRKFAPDSVVKEDEFFKPVYDEEVINVRKRVNTIGLKYQHFWAMPSVYNSMFASLEYQRRVGQGAIFKYENKTYQLSQVDQWMIEFGLRKLMADWPRGQLYLIPSVKYAVSDYTSGSALTVKPFSAGLSVSFSLK